MKNIYPRGITYYKPTHLTPSFIKGSIRIDVKLFLKFIKDHKKEGIVDIDIRDSIHDGGYYLILNEWHQKENDQ